MSLEESRESQPNLRREDRPRGSFLETAFLLFAVFVFGGIVTVFVAFVWLVGSATHWFGIEPGSFEHPLTSVTRQIQRDESSGRVPLFQAQIDALDPKDIQTAGEFLAWAQGESRLFGAQVLRPKGETSVRTASLRPEKGASTRATGTIQVAGGHDVVLAYAEIAPATVPNRSVDELGVSLLLLPTGETAKALPAYHVWLRPRSSHQGTPKSVGPLAAVRLWQLHRGTYKVEANASEASLRKVTLWILDGGR